MKTSLEQERRALLEQFEASRQVYRQMLSPGMPGSRGTGVDRRILGKPESLSVSRIEQWVSNHPLHIAAAVTLLFWLAPGLIRRVRSQQAKRTKSLVPNPGVNPRAGTAKAIATVLVLLLRNPRRLENTASVLTTAWRWLRRTIFPSTTTPIAERKPHA